MKTRKEVAYQVDNEGIGYFLTSYCDANDMPDSELTEAFQNAKDAILKFEALLPDIEEE